MTDMSSTISGRPRRSWPWQNRAVARVTFEPLAAREHSRCLDADEFPGGTLALVMRE